MLALPQEYVGSLTEIKSLTNDLLAMGRVIKIDQEALEISGDEGERMPLLQYRTPVKLFVHNQKEATRIQVGVVYLSTENFVRIEEVKSLQDFERRGAFRVNTNVTAKLTAFMDDEQQARFDEALNAASPEKAEEMLARTEIEVRIMDVSLTGIRLSADTVLAVGNRYFIEFYLLDVAMSFSIKVQRHIKMPSGDTQYGCIFFDYSERQMDILCRELFQLQRFEKNRRLNSASSV